MGMSGSHQRPRIHPADRSGAIYGRLHVEPGVERLPGDPGANLRSALRARMPPHPDRRRPGRDLPPQARRIGSARRHCRPPPADPHAEERPPCRLRRRRAGLADGCQRPPPDRVRGGHPRAARRPGRPDADEHPLVPPPCRDPRRGDRDHRRHGSRHAPEHAGEQPSRAPGAGIRRCLHRDGRAARQGPRHPRAARQPSHSHRHRLARVRSRSATRIRSASASSSSASATPRWTAAGPRSASAARTSK